MPCDSDEGETADLGDVLWYKFSTHDGELYK
jgi:hypothetical protein